MEEIRKEERLFLALESREERGFTFMFWQENGRTHAYFARREVFVHFVLFARPFRSPSGFLERKSNRKIPRSPCFSQLETLRAVPPFHFAKLVVPRTPQNATRDFR